MIENFRKAAVEAALSTKSAQKSIPHWRKKVWEILNGHLSARGIFDLGDHLREIFQSSTQGQIRESANPNASVSAGGAAWESLVCWYLNLCLIGVNSVVIKSKNDLVPGFVRDATTVKYNNFKSNTEADLIYLSFPHLDKWPEMDKNEKFSSYLDRIVPTTISLKEISVGIIQTKTNWNDNAQIPMLWDIVYAAKSFGRNVNVGSNGKSISSFDNFTYSFVTVPTQKDIAKNFKVSSVCVNRVRHISGGNYWGMPTRDGVADSLKEFFHSNMSGQIPASDIISSIEKQLPLLKAHYSYFQLHDQNSSYFLTS